jgi:hypothetical protein
MSDRIVLHLDPGLGWTKPLFVACCRGCGTELARHSRQTVAARVAGRRRCPVCGIRTARRLPGTTSPTSDLALARGRCMLPAPWRRPQDLARPIPARSDLAERR